MLPPGEGWALFLLWVCAHIGGFTANKVNLPPLLGMLVAGIILRNIPQGEIARLFNACFACNHMPKQVHVYACGVLNKSAWCDSSGYMQEVLTA